MAFLRSVSRCNLVSRQITSSRIELSRVETRNLLNKNELSRCLSSAASFPPANNKSGSDGNKKNVILSSGREQSTTTAIGQRDPLDTGFADPKAAFKSKTTFELIRAYVVYTLCSSEFLVDNNMKVRFFPLFGKI